MLKNNYFHLKHQNIYAVPILHYKMEFAAHVKMVIEELKPSCIAVELPETMQAQFMHAASRLPDISVIKAQSLHGPMDYYLSEPCDAAMEGLRSALENQVAAFCIDLDISNYPNILDPIPDAYAIHRIGLNHYYEAFSRLYLNHKAYHIPQDNSRELYMARRLKELSLCYDKVVFIGGMSHLANILKLVDLSSFSTSAPVERSYVEVCTLTEESTRECMAEFGWISTHYEKARDDLHCKEPKDDLNEFPPDRQKLIYHLYRWAAEIYVEASGNPFPGYHFRNIMKFVRNYALINNHLMPNLFQILSAAKGCVDHNYAREVWELATDYPYRKNIDNLPEISLSSEELWGDSKIIRFHLKEKGRKADFHQKRKDRSQARFKPPGPFTICSFPPEDTVIEKFGDFLKKKGHQLVTEDAARTIPFSTSIEDGLDMRETIRHWTEKKLYVKTKGKPQGGVGSIVMVFDEDKPEEEKAFYSERYPWKTTWLGENNQESDMALYATSTTTNVVGPGISRCEYGGFMMSYPPRRVRDVWTDPDYRLCQNKPEVLLMAAIDYAVKPLIVYVASRPPRSLLKSFARRFGKKIVFIPIGQLSPVMINKIRKFHVLDGHDKRLIADEYIY